MATIQDLGKVAYFNKGTYNSEVNYEVNDVVSFNGSSYVSMVNNNRGNLPTNTNYWSIVASKGDKGDTGKAFVIEKTYQTIEDMVADYDNMNLNDYVMISGSIEDEKNATLWTKTETEVSPYKWVYLADFSGASGITGATPNIQIGTVTEGNQPSVTRRGTNENPIFDFVLKTGAKGDTGETGNGISSITKTGTSGLVDTYTVAYTNGNNMTFDVTNGNGIYSIVKTSTSGSVDTYTITYTNGNTSTFDVTNGEVTQEAFDALKEDVEDLRDNQIISDPIEGSEISVSDAAKARVYEFGMSKESSQNNIAYVDVGEWEHGSIDVTTGNDTTDENTARTKDYIKVYPNILYNILRSVYTSYMGFRFYDENKNYLGYHNTPDMVSTNQSANRMDANISNMTMTILNTSVAYMRIFDASNDLNTVYTISTQNTPSPDYPQEVKTVKGYRNLFDKDNATYQNKKIKNENGVEQSSEISGYTSSYVEVKPNTAYSIRGKLIGTDIYCRLYFYDENKNWISRSDTLTIMPNKFTTPNNCYYIQIQYPIAYYDENTVQITEGDQELPYVPYGNNYVGVKVQGKNFIPQTQTGIYTVNNVTITTNNDGSITLNGTSNDRYSYIYINNGYWSSQSDDTNGRFKVKANTNYTLKGTNNSNVRFRIRNITDGTNDSNASNNYTFSYSSDKNIIIMLYIYPNVTFDNVVLYPQLEQGTTSTEYEPHKETIVPIPLNGNEIAGIGDYKDELIVDKSGKVWLNKLTGKKIFNGNEEWNLSTAGGLNNYYNDNLLNNGLFNDTLNYLSNYFRPILNADRYIDSTFFININQRIVFTNSKIATVNEWQQWLSIHNTDVYYVLVTPQLIDLNATVDLKLFKGVNNITNSEDADMKIRYVESIDSVINELRNAILEIGGGE